jgi:DnaK suppressor protein
MTDTNTTPAQIEARRRLRERADHLTQALAAAGIRPDDSRLMANEESGLGDDAHARAPQAVADPAVERDLAELRIVEAALARIDDGSYGACTDCGRPIAPARLAGQPAALRCMACQAIADRLDAGAAD